MTLSTGIKLAHYEISSQLGKGGMGEVYKAKDQKLGRDVAIKVLPEEFAKDADRVARFQREAKLLASLNHPNIAAIHGLEESDGTHFLVLELIEGDTLANRLKRGAIPVEESLKLALQIAEALEAAHEKGVIHRDLKPANIKVTPDGKVKVLDFGLAKAFAGDQAEVNLSHSPTLSEAATLQGVILGTAAYMSPEQARGKPVDKRTDIWAFGCVLFEMLTGKSLFAGEDVTSTLARVLEREPHFSILPPTLHPRIRFLLERCLKKEPKDRYSGISDARVEIQEVLADPSGVFVQAPTAETRAGLRMMLPWIAATAGVAVIITALAVWKLKPTPQPEPRQVMRFAYEIPEDQGNFQNLAVSPDGKQFVYGTNKGFYLRFMDELNARYIPGTDEYSLCPFFSPDGQWIGYFSSNDQKLKKIATGGGAPVALCEASFSSVAASWNTNNTIVYSDGIGGIWRVSANGGTPQPLIKQDAADGKAIGRPFSPQILPDGNTLLFTGSFGGNAANNQITIQSLKSGERKVLFRGGDGARYLPTGHIVYSLINNNVQNLFAVPFDFDRLELTGGPISILEGIGYGDVSNSGTLVYVTQEVAATATPYSTLVWVNREGKEEPLAIAPHGYGPLKISPDGSQVAFSWWGENEDIWIWDLSRETSMRLTFDEAVDGVPLWTLDGKRIVYSSSREGGLMSIYWKAADGTGEVNKIGSVPDRMVYPYSWLKDGKTFVMEEVTFTPYQADIGMMSMEGERKPLLNEKYNESYPRISPDGRWMAYESNESGKYEVYVHSFPDLNKGKWQVSTNGGDSPLWSPDGRELFYRSGDSFMAVDVETEPIFKAGKPKVLFKGTYISYTTPFDYTMWDISPDGKRFLLMRPTASTFAVPTAAVPGQKINIVLNWFEELKDRVPTN